MFLNYICPIYSTLDQYSLTLSLCHYFCHFLFSCEVMSNSLRPYVLQHAQLPCSLLFPSLLRFMPIEPVMLPNHLILYRPLLLLPSTFPIIRVFSNESALHIRWPNYWSFSIGPSNEYSGLISFRID